MAALSVFIDRDTQLLLPPNLRDWVPTDDLVHFILNAVSALARGPGQRTRAGSPQ